MLFSETEIVASYKSGRLLMISIHDIQFMVESYTEFIDDSDAICYTSVV